MSQTGPETPKDIFQPAFKRSFGRSDSTASVDSPKERIGESLAPCRTFVSVFIDFMSDYLLTFFFICVVVPPSEKPATTSLRIDRFVRPFTLKAVQELLGKTGTVQDFWMDHIKTHCYVTVCFFAKPRLALSELCCLSHHLEMKNQSCHSTSFMKKIQAAWDE